MEKIPLLRRSSAGKRLGSTMEDAEIVQTRPKGGYVA
jgi:hypothetical protein